MANSSIKVVGRLDAGRGRPPRVRLPAARQRQRATLAKPGTMFVSQPEIPVPLCVEFPFPAWATRQAECGTAARRAGEPANGLRVQPAAGSAADDAPPF